MDAGMNFSVAGSWEAPSEDFPHGRLVSSNALVTANRRSQGIVDLTLLYPVNEGNIACVVTQRGTPHDLYHSVVQTDNRVKTVEFTAGEQGFTDQSFDFIFVHMAQPTQSGL